MVFNYYMNSISRLGTGLAKVIFTIGVLLIGFGALILAFPEIFAVLAAAVLLMAGGGCMVIAGKIFWQNRGLKKRQAQDSDAYRENVRIHVDKHNEI